VDGDREIHAALEQHWTASAAGDHRSVRAELMIDTFGNRMKASTSMRAGLQKEEQRCFDEWLLGWDYLQLWWR
jgi:hypothetical protein